MENFELKMPKDHELYGSDLVSFMELVAEDEGLYKELDGFCKSSGDWFKYRTLDKIPEWHYITGNSLPEGVPMLDILDAERTAFVQSLHKFISRVTNSGS